VKVTAPTQLDEAGRAKAASVHLVFAQVNFGDLPYLDGSVAELPGTGSTTEIRRIAFHRDHVVKDFPLLFCPKRVVDALEMNLFMEHRYRGKVARPKIGGNRNLRGGVTAKTLRSVANSLRGFLGWLALTGTDWREVYATGDSDRARSWLPPYQYRAFLIARVEAGEISRDTANLYLNHVRQFYEWGVRTARIQRVPFKYKHVLIKKARKDGAYDLLFGTPLDDKALLIQTSDLSIPRKYRSKGEALAEGLTPFDAQELEWFFSSKHMLAPGRRLWAQLAHVCGLRAHEVAELSEEFIVQPSRAHASLYPVRVLGKFNKERTILIPRFLMDALYVYKNSDDRLLRAAKWDVKHGSNSVRPLFLNRSGEVIKSASLTNLTTCVRRELAVDGIQFRRSFHDLRATFATTLAKFMLERHMPLGYIQYKLMALLGHANFSTTQKYINFARTVTFERQMQDWVERIFAGLRPALDSESREYV